MNLQWKITKGGALESGPCMVVERIDGTGWNGTALFDDERGFIAVALSVPKEEAIAACERHAFAADAAQNDTALLDWLLPIVTGYDNAETNRRTLALADVLMQGAAGREAIIMAMKLTKDPS